MSNYSIANYTGAQLAKMNTEELTSVLGTYVRSLVTKATRTVIRENYKSEADFTRALARKAEAELALSDYIDEQRALFMAKKLNPDRAYKEAIVPTGEILPNGVEMFKIVPRGFDLEPEETDPDTDIVRVRLNEHPAMNVSKDEARGRFGDGGLLIEQSVCSVDLSERM